MVNNYDCLAFIKQVYPKDLPLNTAIITSDSRQTLDLNIFLSQSKFNTSVYDKSVNCSFPNVNFPFLDGDVLAVLPYAVYISQLSRFVLLLIIVSDFNDTSKLRKSFKNIIHKGYDLLTIVGSLKQIFFAKTKTICL
jgi:hypothetical protein